MKYFIDNENCKVRIAWATPALDPEYVNCWSVDGKEYRLPTCVICDDDEQDYVEISIPIEFPNGFVPPETFDIDRCMWCPFNYVEEKVEDYCNHKDYKKQNGCPIRKCFNLK